MTLASNQGPCTKVPYLGHSSREHKTRNGCFISATLILVLRRSKNCCHWLARMISPGDHVSGEVESRPSAGRFSLGTRYRSVGLLSRPARSERTHLIFSRSMKSVTAVPERRAFIRSVSPVRLTLVSETREPMGARGSPQERRHYGGCWSTSGVFVHCAG
jgi:hypothetical protein